MCGGEEVYVTWVGSGLSGYHQACFNGSGVVEVEATELQLREVANGVWLGVVTNDDINRWVNVFCLHRCCIPFVWVWVKMV